MNFYTCIATGITAALLSTSGFANQKVLCPTIESVKKSGFEMALHPSTSHDGTTQTYSVQTPCNAIMFEKHGWSVKTVIVAKNLESAKTKAVKNLNSIYHQSQIYAYAESGYWQCDYSGEYGSVFVFTPIE